MRVRFPLSAPNIFALIVQRTEQEISTLSMGVRFPLGVPKFKCSKFLLGPVWNRQKVRDTVKQSVGMPAFSPSTLFYKGDERNRQVKEDFNCMSRLIGWPRKKPIK